MWLPGDTHLQGAGDVVLRVLHQDVVGLVARQNIRHTNSNITSKRCLPYLQGAGAAVLRVLQQDVIWLVARQTIHRQIRKLNPSKP